MSTEEILHNDRGDDPTGGRTEDRTTDRAEDRATDRATDRADDRAEDDSDLLQLSVGGMSCAACARRVEKKLNALPGVSASVNYATERAVVAGLPATRGAEAVAAVESAGYSATVHDLDEIDEWSRRASTARLASVRRRLFLAALLTIPLCDVTIVLALVPGLRFPFWELVCVLLALPVITWAAAPFHRAAWRGLRHRTTTMDTLVSLGITASFGWAVVTLALDALGVGTGENTYWLGFGVTPQGANSLYLDVAAGLTTFQLAGRYFETRARRRAGDVLSALADLAPTHVRVLQEGPGGTVEVEMRATAVKRGDLVVVRAGETIAVDGTVTEGEAAVDTSAMTGEPLPRIVGTGDEVSAGTVSTDGRLLVQAAAVGAHTRLSQMSALAEAAQSRKAGVQKHVDRIVTVFVPAVLVLSALVLAGWLVLGGDVRESFSAAVAVLIIACPCALGLATPTALMVGVGRGSQLGILVKGPDALEASGKLDTVVLDKTGTVTTGRMTLHGVHPVDGADPAEVLRLAAAAEHGSEHLIAAAITTAGEVTAAGPGELLAATDFRTLPGLGVSATVEGRSVLVGSARLAGEQGILVTTDVAARCEEIGRAGRTGVLVAVDGAVVGVLDLGDEIEPTAAPTVQALRALGLRTVLLTGDNRYAGEAVGLAIGVDEVIAEVMPSDKAAVVQRMRAAGHVVAVVGDGINDAAALAEADLGMAVVEGSDIALKAADVVLVRRDLRTVADAVVLSRKTLRTIHGNLVWALGYNIVAIPLAAAGWLNPLIAAAAMSLSSVLVVTNSLRLRNTPAISTGELSSVTSSGTSSSDTPASNTSPSTSTSTSTSAS